MPLDKVVFSCSMDLVRNSSRMFHPGRVCAPPVDLLPSSGTGHTGTSDPFQLSICIKTPHRLLSLLPWAEWTHAPHLPLNRTTVPRHHHGPGSAENKPLQELESNALAPSNIMRLSLANYPAVSPFLSFLKNNLLNMFCNEMQHLPSRNLSVWLKSWSTHI